MIFFAVCFCYIGALIGAGFASGKEIQLFFTQFGTVSLCSTAFAGFLFAFLAYATLRLCQRHKITNLYHFFTFCLGNVMGRCMYHLLRLFLFFSITVMISAWDSLCQVFFLDSPGTGGFLFTLFLYFFLLKPKAGMITGNVLFVPILIAMMLFLWQSSISPGILWNIIKTESIPSLSQWGNSFFWGILYVSYNFLSAGAILLPFAQEENETKSKTAAIGGGSAGAILGLLLFFGNLALLSQENGVALSPMPFLAMAGNFPLGMIFYAFPFGAAVITTALTNSFALLQDSSFLTKGGILLFSFMVAAGGDFSQLISLLYPFTGVGGVCLILAVTYRFLFDQKKR